VRTALVAFATGVADPRGGALVLAAKYRAWTASARLFEMAWAHAQAQLHDLGLQGEDAHLYQRLLRSVVYADPRARAPAEVLQQNTEGQPSLWAYGISGDYPIVLARIASDDDLALVQDLLRAHQYWRLRNVAVDLVILVEGETSYRQGLVDEALTLVRSGRSTSWLNRRGGIFVLPGASVPEKDRILLRTATRIDLEGARGSLARQLARVDPDPVVSTRPRPATRPAPLAPAG